MRSPYAPYLWQVLSSFVIYHPFQKKINYSIQFLEGISVYEKKLGVYICVSMACVDIAFICPCHSSKLSFSSRTSCLFSV